MFLRPTSLQFGAKFPYMLPCPFSISVSFCCHHCFRTLTASLAVHLRVLISILPSQVVCPSTLCRYSLQAFSQPRVPPLIPSYLTLRFLHSVVSSIAVPGSRGIASDSSSPRRAPPLRPLRPLIRHILRFAPRSLLRSACSTSRHLIRLFPYLLTCTRPLLLPYVLTRCSPYLHPSHLSLLPPLTPAHPPSSPGTLQPKRSLLLTR